MFPVHGKWKIAVSNNIVMQWFGGAWNEEAIIQYTKEFQLKTAKLTGSEWAILSFFEEWELGVPEIEPLVVEHCNRFKRNGCVKDCHVYSVSSVKKDQLEKMIPHSEPGYERQVFDTGEAAYAWLQSYNFSLHDLKTLVEFTNLKM